MTLGIFFIVMDSSGVTADEDVRVPGQVVENRQSGAENRPKPKAKICTGAEDAVTLHWFQKAF